MMEKQWRLFPCTNYREDAMAQLVVRSMVKTLVARNRRFDLSIPEFTLQAGDRKAIIGITGSGKTTAMDVLALASPPTSAEYFALQVGDRDPIHLNLPKSNKLYPELRAKHFGYVLQTSQLFPFLNLGENISLGCRLSRYRGRDFIPALMQRFDLNIPLTARISEMSVGQRQRVAVARAVAHCPDFIFCDEPTASLDPSTADRLVATLVELAGKTNAAILMVTHDLHLAERNKFEIYQMDRSPSGDSATLLRARARPQI